MKNCPNCNYHKPVITEVLEEGKPQGYCAICSLCGPFGNTKEDAEAKWDKLPRTQTYIEITLGLLREIKERYLSADK